MQMKLSSASLLGIGITFLMTACSTTPPVIAKKPSAPSVSTQKPPAPTPTPSKSGGYYLDDGPEANPPPNLDDVPDAVPRKEPLHRYANREYNALGNTYTPYTTITPYQQEGWASWYGKRFHGKKTASGEVYDMYGMTAAHPTLPIPSYVRVTCLNNGKSVVVRVNDRGPFAKNRVIDLSYAAAHKLSYLGAGSTRVRVESIDLSQNDVNGIPLSSGLYLQLGAFTKEEKAHKLREKVQATIEAPIPPVHVVLTDKLHRVTLGPYQNEADAEIDIERLQQTLGMTSIKLVR